MRLMVLSALLMGALGNAAGQAALADFLAGNLVNPKVGQWAWYDIAEKATGLTYSVRQAIVGTEKVGTKTGHWFEMEVVPPVGYSQVYRMLLTGPASDPKNIHKMVIEDGMGPPQEIQVDSQTAEPGPMLKAKRTRVGKEAVRYLKGTIEAEHYRFEADEGKLDVWINDKVAPTGIVKIASNEGDLILRDFGVGGDDADATSVKRSGPKTNISIRPRAEDTADTPENPPRNNAKRP
jgi:hypothetical protein